MRFQEQVGRLGSTHTWISSAGRYRSVDDHTLDDFGLENKSKARQVLASGLYRTTAKLLVVSIYYRRCGSASSATVS